MREFIQHFLSLFSHSRDKRALFFRAVFSLCGTWPVRRFAASGFWMEQRFEGEQSFWVEQRFSAAIQAPPGWRL
jgi:hypothetical protein